MYLENQLQNVECNASTLSESHMCAQRRLGIPFMIMIRKSRFNLGGVTIEISVRFEFYTNIRSISLSLLVTSRFDGAY